MNRRAFLGALPLLAAPIAVEAQPTEPVRTVGILAHVPAMDFEQGLRDLGWVDGRNLRIARRMSTSTDSKELTRFASELLRIPVDVIFAGNAAATRAAVDETRTVPIVTVSADPVGGGFAASLARPRTNVTGLVVTQLMGKRLELLTQARPAARRVALLANPANPGTPAMRKEAEAAAGAIGVTLLPFEVSAPGRLAAVLAAVAKAQPDALLVTGDPLFFVSRQQLVEAAARHRLPAIWEFRSWVDDGGLMSYGVHPAEMYRRAATYVDRILKGAKPADLPIEQPTRFELVINLKTAKALGLTIQPSLLQRADQVIE